MKSYNYCFIRVLSEDFFKNVLVSSDLAKLGERSFADNCIKTVTLPATLNNDDVGEKVFYKNYFTSDKANSDLVLPQITYAGNAANVNNWQLRAIVNPQVVNLELQNSADSSEIESKKVIAYIDGEYLEQSNNYLLKRAESDILDEESEFNQLVDNYYVRDKEYIFKTPKKSGYTPKQTEVKKTITASDSLVQKHLF